MTDLWLASYLPFDEEKNKKQNLKTMRRYQEEFEERPISQYDEDYDGNFDDESEGYDEDYDESYGVDKLKKRPRKPQNRGVRIHQGFVYPDVGPVRGRPRPRVNSGILKVDVIQQTATGNMLPVVLFGGNTYEPYAVTGNTYGGVSNFSDAASFVANQTAFYYPFSPSGSTPSGQDILVTSQAMQEDLTIPAAASQMRYTIFPSQRVPTTRFLKNLSDVGVRFGVIRIAVPTNTAAFLNLITSMNLSPFKTHLLKPPQSNPLPASVFRQPNQQDPTIVDVKLSRPAFLDPSTSLVIYWPAGTAFPGSAGQTIISISFLDIQFVKLS